jgi:hypothetical protein
MKDPTESDFEIKVFEAGVEAIFKPTQSHYLFYRLADAEDIARLGPVSPKSVRHAGPTGDTDAYLSDEVASMAHRLASEAAKG